MLVTIASDPTPAARVIAQGVARGLALPLLDLTGGGEDLAASLRLALASDEGVRREAVDLIARLLSSPSPRPEGIRELALRLATRSGGVVLDSRCGPLQAGHLRSLRVTLEEGGRPICGVPAGRDLIMPHLSLDVTALAVETVVPIILAAARATGGGTAPAASVPVASTPGAAPSPGTAGAGGAW